MLTFFRRIRKGLLESGRLSKYLVYAIGEILLVMVGILLALQVNNWNEERKLKSTEIEILQELKNGLIADINTRTNDSIIHTKSILACEFLRTTFEKELPYHDSLARKFSEIHYFTNFTPNTGGYESLKSFGVTTISNVELRNSLIKLVDQWYKILILNQRDMTNYILDQKVHLLSKHFNSFKVFMNRRTEVIPEDVDGIYGGGMKPNNYKDLTVNPEFIYHLNALFENHNHMLMINNIVLNKIREIIADIKNEIIRLEGN